ncbi:hypothetical protein ACFCWY_31280 [Streptomyces sp. NPDC056362]|uniref:hypothetical protein n=1 Tax=unclassified Streptomyces TaxID=2593676 RepID=UPI0035D693DA
MATPSPEARCEYCLGPVERSKGGGRPRIYCRPLCRRRAQRERDRAHRVSRPSWQPIAHDLVTNALYLRDHKQLALKDILELAGDVGRDAECLAAVAVDATRNQGSDWSEIAAAAGRTEASARAKWGGSQVSRLVAARRQPACAEAEWDPATVSAEVPRVPRQRARTAVSVTDTLGLGSALRTLYRKARTSLVPVSAATNLPAAVISALLEDRTVASWPEVYTLAHALGGDPEDLRHLWDSATKDTAAVDPDGENQKLAAALRGARLAAGAPDLTTVCPAGIDVSVIQAALRGRVVPPWSVLRVFLAALGADPGSFEALWLAARVADLAERKGGLRP